MIMVSTGKNVSDLRRSNISLILNLLYFEGTQSRKMLSRKSSLTPAAVTILTMELIEKGYIINSEITLRNGKAGRSEQLIDINYKNLFIVGMRIDRETVEIRLFNLGLECIGSLDVEITTCVNVDDFFELLCDKIAFLMVQNNLTSKMLLGIGVTILGIVDSIDGVSISSFGIIPDNTNIRMHIEKRLPLPVRVNNNVRSMLLAESAINHHNQGVSHLFIKYGPGLGAAFSIAQQAYNGVNHRAMELGHVTINPDGELCRCGRRGCLETIVSYEAILSEAELILSKERTPALYAECEKGELTICSLVQSVVGGDVLIRQMLREKFVLFSQCLESNVTILDPKTVSICSEIFVHEPIRDMFLEQVAIYAKSLGNRLVLNPDSAEIEKVGAASLVVHSFLAGQSVGEQY